ncbi:hypothetical protein AJ80_01560 [Polytolypa hystricis UAMH7299]|uniref:C3H1-type domain-containing protein n=1 Tax=Polytolypa hystricis (strain UAMH7299) TaxID=1447883 RepID=A0A2B7YRZ0_POLH7|nr:hypothetical protein AJ80_01560 [Polytolypa hystricis UAMH7299]
MTEDQDLLAKIGQLAGQINLHKSQNGAPSHSSRGGHGAAPYSTQTIHSRSHTGWAPYRGRGRPARRAMAPHRHRTLILNSQTPQSENTSGFTSADASNDETSESKPTTQNGWVAKRDRHMQLINSAIYDKEAPARTKAIEETRKLKAQKKTEREEAKVLRHAQGAGRHYPTSTPGGSYQILIQGIPFQVAKGGSKLIKINNDPNTANNTPKKVNVGGVNFIRSKKGNLHRLGLVVSKRKTDTVKKKDELCKRFTATGSCYKGPKCPFIHDPDKVAICKDFLQTGKCDAGAACDLSHDPTPERTPACVHFIRGRCSNPACRYTHVKVNPGAPVCRDFAILGYCGKGATCDQRHVHECPDYANTGTCDNKKCQLPHVDRAGQIRKIAANKAETSDSDNINKEGAEEDDEEDDVSSEEEAYEEIDSDDVDSDDLEDEPEMMITDDMDTAEILQQQDFVHF